jgi:hypothetical protein
MGADRVLWALFGYLYVHPLSSPFFLSVWEWLLIFRVAAVLFVVMYGRVKEALVLQRQHQEKVKEQ